VSFEDLSNPSRYLRAENRNAMAGAMNILVPPLFEIFADDYGLWRARRRDGLAAGIFASRAEAARFVLQETATRHSGGDDPSRIRIGNDLS
jgi:hypothetical protein